MMALPKACAGRLIAALLMAPSLLNATASPPPSPATFAATLAATLADHRRRVTAASTPLDPHLIPPITGL